MTNRLRRWLIDRHWSMEPDKSSFWYCFKKDIIYRKGSQLIAMLFLSPIIGGILLIPLMIIGLIIGKDFIGENYSLNVLLLGLLVVAIWIIGSEYRGFYIIRQFSEKIIRANSYEPKLSSFKDLEKYSYELEKYFQKWPLEAITGKIGEKEIENIKKKTIKIEIGRLIEMLIEINEKGS